MAEHMTRPISNAAWTARVEALKHDLAGLRTGRASIDAARSGHGRGLRRAHAAQPGRDRLRARAAHADRAGVGQSRTSAPVDKAIRSAGLGLNPIIDGQTLRLPIPDLTEERRKELAKLAGQYAEKARVAVRNVRRDGMDALKADEKKGEISEDEHKRLETEVQKLTDEHDRRNRRRVQRPRKRKSSGK